MMIVLCIFLSMMWLSIVCSFLRSSSVTVRGLKFFMDEGIITSRVYDNSSVHILVRIIVVVRITHIHMII